MNTPSRQANKHSGGWIVLYLFLMPTVLVFIPVLVEINPREALFYTPAVPMVFNILVIAYAVLIIRPLPKDSSLSIKSTFGLLLFVLLSIIVYSTIFVAVDVLYSLTKVLDLLLFVCLAFSSAYIFQIGGARLARNILLAIFGGVVISMPLLAVLYYFQFPDYYYWPRFLPGYVFIRIFGFSLAASIAAGTGLLTLPSLQTKIPRVSIFFGLVVLWTALFWSGSRGGIFALILVIPVMSILLPNLRAGLPIAILAMVVGAILSLNMTAPDSDFGFIQAFFTANNYTSANAFTTGRLTEWSIVLEWISEKPLFGHGYGQTFLIGSAADVVKHAHVHNIVLEAALSWGWVGAACAGYLIISTWVSGVRKTMLGDMEERLPALLVISVMLVYAWVDGVYFYYQALIPMGLCVGIILANSRKLQAEPASPSC